MPVDRNVRLALEIQKNNQSNKMSKCLWILDSFSSENVEFVAEIKRQNQDLIEFKNYHRGLVSALKDRPVIFHGSIEMSKIIKNDISPTCAPVLFLTPDNYLCSRYYSYFGDLLFNDKYALVSLAELARQRYLYYGIFGKDALIFLRPDSGDKQFQAQLLDLIDLDKFVEKHSDIKHNLVLVSTPKKIIGEWRYIVTSDKQILGYSLYNYQGQITKIPSAPPEATELCKKILDIGYFPDRVFCIDICSDSDNNYHLLELNSFSSAGLYACNKENIVREVSKIVIEESQKLQNRLNTFIRRKLE